MRASIVVTFCLGACTTGVVTNQPKDETETDTGVELEANLLVTTTELAFGEIAYGDLITGAVTVSNTGTEDLTLSSILTDPPFEVTPSNLIISGGATSRLTVTVQAQSYEVFNKRLTIQSDDVDTPLVEIPLTATTISDADGDGYILEAAGGDDCDDTDANVNPGVLETWYDGVDGNCDGGSDYDQDGDGWEDEVSNPDVATGGGDCQDSNPNFYPGASDVPYDNMDTNCDDANDWDADGDSYASLAYGRGTDCDDSDPAVNSAGFETLNGGDDDCDGEVDNQARPQYAPYVYESDASSDTTGYTVAVGDLDRDGYAEIVVGSPSAEAGSSVAQARGSVAIFAGGPGILPTGTAIDRADWYIIGASTSDRIGTTVTVLGDFEDDGYQDLAIYGQTSSYNGIVYIISGEEVTRSGDTRDAMATFTGNSSSYLGRGLITNADLDGDGADEFGAAFADGGANAMALHYGGNPALGTVSLVGMDAAYRVTGAELPFYRNAPVGADLDGDGYDDLLLSDGTDDSVTSDAGASWILWGGPSRYDTGGITASIEVAATRTLAGSSSSAWYSWTTQAGDDWDGDGDAELWVYQPNTGLHVVEGRPRAEWPSLDTVSAAAVTYTWYSTSTDADQIRQVGDWTGDGSTEMLVFSEDASGEYGRLTLFSSEVQSGTIDEHDGLIGEMLGDEDYGSGNLGYGTAPLGADIDGDGDSDTVIGDPDFDGGAGEAYVLLNKL